MQPRVNGCRRVEQAFGLRPDFGTATEEFFNGLCAGDVRKNDHCDGEKNGDKLRDFFDVLFAVNGSS